MEYITREPFDQMLKNKNEIEAEDLVYVLEEKLGYSVYTRFQIKEKW